MTFDSSRETISLCNLSQRRGSGARGQNVIDSGGEHRDIASGHDMASLCIADQFSRGRKAVGRNDGTVEGHGLQDDLREPFKDR
jgi:hypothetical protein